MKRHVKVVLGILVLTGCGDAPPPQETEVPGSTAATPEARLALTPLLAEGRTLYGTLCWSCHGSAGRGDGPVAASASTMAPPSFHTQDYATASADDLVRRFRVGLDEADADHPHMQYVASVLQPDRFRAALAYVPALAYPAELPGSALAGQELYAFRCVACHGVDGRGDGPAAAAVQAPAPADFTRDSLLVARDWDGLFARIHDGGQDFHGSSMPPWGTALDDGQIWDLVAYLGTFQPGALSPPPWSTGR